MVSHVGPRMAPCPTLSLQLVLRPFNGSVECPLIDRLAWKAVHEDKVTCWRNSLEATICRRACHMLSLHKTWSHCHIFSFISIFSNDDDRMTIVLQSFRHLPSCSQTKERDQWFLSQPNRRQPWPATGSERFNWSANWRLYSGKPNQA